MSFAAYRGLGRYGSQKSFFGYEAELSFFHCHGVIFIVLAVVKYLQPGEVSGVGIFIIYVLFAGITLPATPFAFIDGLAACRRSNS